MEQLNLHTHTHTYICTIFVSLKHSLKRNKLKVCWWWVWVWTGDECPCRDARGFSLKLPWTHLLVGVPFITHRDTQTHAHSCSHALLVSHTHRHTRTQRHTHTLAEIRRWDCISFHPCHVVFLHVGFRRWNLNDFVTEMTPKEAFFFLFHRICIFTDLTFVLMLRQNVL